MNAICMYVFINVADGRIYVGQTSNNPSHRKAQHKHNAFKLNINIGLYRAMRKYGWECFEFKVIAMCTNRSDADETERCLIEQFKSSDPKYGYNVHEGGRSGYSWTDDQYCEFMRYRWTEKKREVHSQFMKSNPNKGQFEPGHTRGGRKPGGVPWNAGKQSPTKLTLEQIEQIRNSPMSIRELAKVYGVGKSTIQYHRTSKFNKKEE